MMILLTRSKYVETEIKVKTSYSGSLNLLTRKNERQYNNDNYTLSGDSLQGNDNNTDLIFLKFV